MFLAIGPVDVFVLIAYLIAAIVIGLWVGGRQRNLDAYLLGDRNLAWWAILGSIVATETSAATVLSVPGEGYGPTGMKFLQLTFGYIVGRVIIVYTLLPLYFRGKLFTAYEVLEERFGGATKRTASFIFLITRNLGDGLRLFLAAIALEKLAGFPFAHCVVITGVVTIVYTFFGGMRSVVWNDCVQLVIYMAGGAVALFVILNNLPGGWDDVLAYAGSHGSFQVFDWRWSWTNQFTFWAGLLGGATLTIGTHGTDHMMVQRYLSARSQADAARAIVASGFVVCAQFALFLLIGVGLATYYTRLGIKFDRPDTVFAQFIVDVFPRNTGLIGVMLAAILAATMSTVSSSLNSSASALVNDFYVSWRKERPTAEHLLAVTRGCTVVFGLVQIGIGITATGLRESVVRNVLTIAGFSFGLLLGVFALGVLTRRVGQVAALLGLLTGLVVLLNVQFVVPSYGVKIAFPWLAVIGSATTFTAGILASLIFPRRSPVE
jgi:SSS family transporter